MGCLKSLKITPSDRQYTTFYWSAIVNIAVSCIPFTSYLTLNNIVTEIWVRGHSRSFKMVPFESLGAVSYSLSIVTMALSCIICEIKQDIGRKWYFFHTTVAFGAPIRGVPVGILPSRLVWENKNGEKNFEDIYVRCPCCVSALMSP